MTSILGKRKLNDFDSVDEFVQANAVLRGGNANEAKLVVGTTVDQDMCIIRDQKTHMIFKEGKIEVDKEIVGADRIEEFTWNNQSIIDNGISATLGVDLKKATITANTSDFSKAILTNYTGVSQFNSDSHWGVKLTWAPSTSSDLTYFGVGFSSADTTDVTNPAIAHRYLFGSDGVSLLPDPSATLYTFNQALGQATRRFDVIGTTYEIIFQISERQLTVRRQIVSGASPGQIFNIATVNYPQIANATLIPYIIASAPSPGTLTMQTLNSPTENAVVINGHVIARDMNMVAYHDVRIDEIERSLQFGATQTDYLLGTGDNTGEIATTNYVDNHVGDNAVSKGGDTDGADLVMGTLDDYEVKLKQNSHDQVVLGNNRLDVCVCQSTAIVWDPASNEGTGTNLTIGPTPGLVTQPNTNSVRRIYSTETFDPTVNDYDIIFNVTQASKFTTTPENVDSQRVEVQFASGNPGDNDAPFPGTTIELMNDNPNPRIRSQSDVDNIADLGGAYIIKLEIRNQVGVWYKDGTPYTTASPIILDQTNYRTCCRTTSAGFTASYTITTTWSVPGHQLQVNADSIKPKVPIVLRDNYDRSLRILDESGNKYITVNTSNQSVELATRIAVQGEYIQLVGDDNATPPVHPIAGRGRLYKKPTPDEGLYWKPEVAGAEVDLTLGSNSVQKGGEPSGELILGTQLDETVRIAQNNVTFLGHNKSAIDLGDGVHLVRIDVPDNLATALEIGPIGTPIISGDTTTNVEKVTIAGDLEIDDSGGHRDFIYQDEVCEVYVNQNPTATDITATSTWYNVEYDTSGAGVAVAEYELPSTLLMQGVITDPNTNGTNRVVQIKYRGARTKLFQCGISFSFSSDGNNTTYHFAAWKYDDSAGTAAIIPASEQKVDSAGSGNWLHISMNFITVLDTDDYVYLRVEQTDGTATDVTVEDANYAVFALSNSIGF